MTNTTIDKVATRNKYLTKENRAFIEEQERESTRAFIDGAKDEGEQGPH